MGLRTLLLIAMLSASTPAIAQDLTFQNGRPTFTFADGKYSLSLGLILNFDFGGYFTGSAPSPNSRQFNLASSGEGLRRARLPVIFRWQDLTANITPEFGGIPNRSPRLYEASLSYSGIKPLTIAAGYLKPGLTLQDSMSSQARLFMEKPSITNIATDIAGGPSRAAVSVKANGEQWYVAGALTGRKYGAQDTGASTPSGATGRITGRPLAGGDFDIHLGLSASDRFSMINTGSGPSISFADYPELRADPVKLIGTGSIARANSAYEYGPEFAVRYKNFLLQGEFIQVEVLRSASAPDLGFHGGYAEASWVITGEPHVYNAANAVFDNPIPAQPFSVRDGTWGAFELVARYSATDLNSNSGYGVPLPVTGGVFGGYQQIFSFGLNWYLNRNYRIMADYFISQIDKLNAAGTTQIGQRFQAIGVRLQASY